MARPVSARDCLGTGASSRIRQGTLLPANLVGSNCYHRRHAPTTWRRCYSRGADRRIHSRARAGPAVHCTCGPRLGSSAAKTTGGRTTPHSARRPAVCGSLLSGECLVLLRQPHGNLRTAPRLRGLLLLHLQARPPVLLLLQPLANVSAARHNTGEGTYPVVAKTESTYRFSTIDGAVSTGWPSTWAASAALLCMATAS